MNASEETRRRLLYALLIPGVLLGCWAIFGLVERFRPGPQPEVSSPVIRTGVSRVRIARALVGAVKALGRHDDWQAVIKVCDQALEAEDNGVLRLMRAEARLHLGMRAEAADDWAAFLQPMPSGGGLLADSNNPVATADLLAVKGKPAEYATHVRALIDAQNPATATALDANNAAWAAVLLPGALTDYTKTIALARRGVDAARRERDRATYLNTLGVALFRAGKDQDALTALLNSEKVQVEPFNWPFLAMASQRLGKPADATRWSRKLREHLRNTYGDTNQGNRHELVLFAMEMDQRLGPRSATP